MPETITIANLADRAAIHDLILNFATGIDRRDWTLFRSIFTDEIVLDYSSWSGQPKAPVRADEWVARVRRVLSGFDATQHVLTNMAISLGNEEATATIYMSANHYLVEAGNRHMHSIGGYYEHQLVRIEGRWRIFAATLNVTWEMGDRSIFNQATSRFSP